MDIIEIFKILYTILSISILFFLVAKPKIGALLYLLYMFIAPFMYIGGFILYTRTTAALFLVLFILKFWNKIRQQDFKPFFPYIAFIGTQALLLITSSIIDYSFEQWMLRISPFIFLLFLHACIVVYPESIKLFKWTLFGVMLVAVLYGLFLTTMPGLNPYKLIQLPLFGREFNEAYAAGNSGLSDITDLAEGRLFGRISSIFDHPMTYGLNLGLFFIYCFYIFRERKRIQYLLLGLILIAVLTSGVRTALGAVIITVLLGILYLKKIKYFLYGGLAFILVINVLPIIYPEANDYVMSIINPDESSTKGSSMDMRLEQLIGSYNIVENDLIFGKGYCWTSWYNTTFGTHPTALWFESLIYVILVDSGLVGFVIWVIFLLSFYRYIVNNYDDQYQRLTLLSLFVYFIVFCCVTGDFGIQNVLFYYTILVGIMSLENKQKYETFS